MEIRLTLSQPIPVYPIQYFTSRANDSPFGLAGGVFTKDLNRGHRVVNLLQVIFYWISSRGWRILKSYIKGGPITSKWGHFLNIARGARNFNSPFVPRIRIRPNVPQGRPFSFVSKFVRNNHRLDSTLYYQWPIKLASRIPDRLLVASLKPDSGVNWSPAT